MNSLVMARISKTLAPRVAVARAILAVAVAGLLTASCDVHGISDPGSLAALSVSPNPITMSVNGTQQFAATGTDASGATVTVSPSWSVVSGGGTISSSGVFTAGTSPSTFSNTVMATSAGYTSTATVIVTAGPLATITVAPDPATMTIGATQQFTAVGKDASGNVVPITPVWSMVGGGGSINLTTGLFTAGSTSGTYTNSVRASVGGLFGLATVVVTNGPLASITVTPDPTTVQIGAAQQFTAVGADAGGNVVAITPVWSILNGGGTIDAGSGRFTAGSVAGTYANTVSATSGAISGTATVTVSTTPVIPTLATITITPDPATVAAGSTQQFTAVGHDGNGNVFPVVPVWSVVNGGGTIDASSGRFTAGSTSGTFEGTITATIGSIADTATVTVTSIPPVLATITVEPNPATVVSGTTQPFVAVGRDQNGDLITITPIWSVVAGGGSIDGNTGVFTAGPNGGTFLNTIRATSGAISGTATVTVTTIPILTSITVTPNPATVGANTTRAFVAVGRDQSGNLFPIVPSWSVVNGGGVIDPTTGVFTAGIVGSTFDNTVRATSGTVFGTATVTVVAPPLNILNRAAPNGIMAGTAVTCVSLGTIYGDVSISDGSTLNGFGGPPPACQIAGVQHLGDPTAADAQLDLTAAYNYLAGLPCAPANVISADLGGTTKTAGVYCAGTTIGVTGDLTLDGGGNPDAIFVFQAGTGLTTAGNVLLANGAQAKNVYWQVGTSATIGTASQWKGNIVALTSITLVDNANLIGRALARNGAVSMGTNNTILLPDAPLD